MKQPRRAPSFSPLLLPSILTTKSPVERPPLWTSSSFRSISVPIHCCWPITGSQRSQKFIAHHFQFRSRFPRSPSGHLRFISSSFPVYYFHTGWLCPWPRVHGVRNRWRFTLLLSSFWVPSFNRHIHVFHSIMRRIVTMICTERR